MAVYNITGMRVWDSADYARHAAVNKRMFWEDTMKAIVVERPGGPEVLQIQERPMPKPRPGWVLVHVRGFGLNHSELLTRQGESGDAVKFPRVLGIEAV